MIEQHNSKPVRFGLVLSAGGVRGIYAHSGFLKALEDLHLDVSAISGCSAGAIVGGIYASGTPLTKWLKALKNMDKVDFWQPGSWGKSVWQLIRYRGRTFTGIATTDAPMNFCRKNITADTFEACPIPFYSTATSLSTGEKAMFDQGDLALGIAASATIPVLYQPIEIEGEFYCDGGVVDLGPTEGICCKHNLDVVIIHHVASHIKGYHGLPKADDDSWPILEIIDTLMFRNRPWYLTGQPISFHHCPCGCKAIIVVLEPELPDLPWPKTEKGAEVQGAALQQTTQMLAPLLNTLMQNPTSLLEQQTSNAQKENKNE